MKKVTWIVMKGSEEICRNTSKALAECIAKEIGGYLIRYATE